MPATRSELLIHLESNYASGWVKKTKLIESNKSQKEKNLLAFMADRIILM